ncbi:MAG TPA: hypothetical protein VIX17_03240 [Pyrinomonadaceae bacterium]
MKRKLICRSRLAIFAVALLVSSVLIVRAQSTSTDPLKPYTTCKVSGGLKIKEVTRRNATDNYREVSTDKGKQRVSVVAGYRVMFAYPDLTYYFANVKIEQSDPASYAADKEILVNQLKYYSSIKEAHPMIFEDKKMLNDFEHYGMDRDKIDVGDQVGIHILFYDPAQLVVTIYFLNQSKAAFFNNRRYEDIKQYRELRDDLLNSYSECLKRVAGEAKH